MIGYLRGTARAADVLDVGGVGYLVHCPTALPVGDDIELHVHTSVREDAIVLYGFGDPNDRAVFAALVKVTGVGPSIALALLGQLGAGNIAAAVHNNDPAALSTVKGVGTKVANKIVTLCQLPDTITAATAGPRAAELTTVLVDLGWDAPTATAAAATAAANTAADADDSQLLAAALAAARAA